MRGSDGDRWGCGIQKRFGDGAAPTGRVVLEPFSTRIPPELLERLRVAAPQLGLRQGDIAAIAIDDFLRKHGF